MYGVEPRYSITNQFALSLGTSLNRGSTDRLFHVLAGSELCLPIHSFCCSVKNVILHLGNSFCFRPTLFNPLGYLAPQFEVIFLPSCLSLLDQNIFVIELLILPLRYFYRSPLFLYVFADLFIN